MGKEVVLAPYDITGKGEPEVRCEVYSRLLTLINTKEQTEDKTFEIAGKDTLFNIVAGAYLIFVKEGAKAVSSYIEAVVHKLFTEKGDDA